MLYTLVLYVIGCEPRVDSERTRERNTRMRIYPPITLYPTRVIYIRYKLYVFDKDLTRASVNRSSMPYTIEWKDQMSLFSVIFCESRHTIKQYSNCCRQVKTYMNHSHSHSVIVQFSIREFHFRFFLTLCTVCIYCSFVGWLFLIVVPLLEFSRFHFAHYSFFGQLNEKVLFKRTTV